MHIFCPIAIILLASTTAARQSPGPPPPIDPQQWQDQQDMTWADYRPIPGVNWADPSRRGERTLRVALVAVDFADDDRPDS